VDSSFISEILKKVIEAAVLGVGGLLATYFLGRWRGWWASIRRPAASGEHFAILVAKLEGDKDGSQTRHIRNSLNSQFGQESQIEVLFRDETLGMPLGNLRAELSEAEKHVLYHRKVLEVSTHERVPLAWAATQNNLGTALQRLGERRAEKDKPSGCRLLTEARVALAAASEEARNSGASHFVSMAEGNLARVDAAIARLGC